MPSAYSPLRALISPDQGFFDFDFEKAFTYDDDVQLIDVYAEPLRGDRSTIRRTRSLFGRPASAVALLGFTLMTFAFMAAATFTPRRPPPSCNPFAAEGYLDTTTAHLVWRPFDERCPAFSAVPQLAAALKSGSATTEFSWLRNRTVVAYGDSVDRYNVVELCKALGIADVSIDPSHPMFVEDWAGGSDPQPSDRDAGWTAYGNIEARPHWCRIEELDFDLVNFFHYGVGSSADHDYHAELVSMPHYHLPRLVTDRLQHTVLPTLAKMGEQPDLVQFASGIWDAFLANKVDELVKSNNSVTPIWRNEIEKVEWYRNRTAVALDSVERAFPSTQLLYRQSHDIRCDWQGRPCDRMAQLAQVADHLVAGRPRFRINYIGRMLRGQTMALRDAVHPSAPCVGCAELAS